MKNEVMTRDVAINQIEQILEYFEVESIDTAVKEKLVISCQLGRIYRDGDSIVYTLKNPVKLANDDTIDRLMFKEVTANDMRSLDKYPRDADNARSIVMISITTCQPLEVINRLSLTDTTMAGFITGIFG